LGKNKIIGQKGQIPVVLSVIESDSAELFGIGIVGIEPCEHDRLIASQIRGLIHGSRIKPAALKVGLGPDEEKGLTLMKNIEPAEIEVAAVEDIETAGLGEEVIQNTDVVDFSFCYLDKRGDGAPQIEKRMELYGRFALPEHGPGEKRQTQVDGRGVEGIDGFLQLQAGIVVGIEISGLMNQNLGEVSIDAPVARFVGVGQSASGHAATESHVIELRRYSTQTSLDIAEALPVGQLSEGHSQKLVPAGKAFDLTVAAVADNAATELRTRQEIDELDKDGFANVHGPLLAVIGQQNGLEII
jgi:hypothetical protein